MPDRPDLPAVATPWEDPMGNVWCATPYTFEDGTITVWHWYRDQWRYVGIYTLVFVNPAVIAGLGYTIPAGPTPAPTPPKRVAKVVHCGPWKLAMKGGALYESCDGIPWRPSQGSFITAAAEAFAGAGDVLPGEAE